MENPFDQFDKQPAEQENPFDQFDAPQQPVLPPGALQQESTAMAQKFSTPAGPDSEWSNLPKNIIPSAVQVGKDLASAVVHPIQTTKAGAALVKGGIEAATERPGDIESEERKMVGQMAESIKEKYGSLDNLKKDIIKDPIGNLVNVASLFMAGGTALKGVGLASKAGKAAKTGRAITKAGRALTKAGEILEPIEVVKAGISKIADPLSRKMYESAAKFSTTLKPAERTALIKTALEHGIPTTRGGLNKMRNKIDIINESISGKIDELTEAGDKINLSELFKHVDEVKEKAGLTANPLRNRKAVERLRGEIYKYNEKAGNFNLSPADVQRFKQNIYKEISSYYGKSKAPIITETKKALARGAKESLEVLFPEIKQLNKTEGSLIALDEALQRSVNRISNNNIISLSNVIGMGAAGGAGTAVAGVSGGVGGAAVAGVIALLSKPAVKSQLARVVYTLGKNGIKIDPTSPAVRLGLINLGRARYAGQNVNLERDRYSGQNNTPKDKEQVQ